MTTNMDGKNWVPLVEFSVQKGISLSTLRRYIKSNKIAWKLSEGRYLVMDDGTFVAPRNHAGATADPSVTPEFVNIKLENSKLENSRLEMRIRKLESFLMAANEENAELKTLLAFYEEQWAQLSKT